MLARGTLAAGSAFADSSLVATLANPVAKETKEAVGAVVWHCEATTCTSVSNTSSVAGIAACHALARRYGRVVEFVSGSGSMAAEQLVMCNKV